MGIHLVDAFEDALLEFIQRGYANVPQEAARHLGERGLDQVEPGTVFGRMHVFEAAWTACQVRHRLLGDMRAVVVQHDADDGLGRIVFVESAQQRDELHAAVARLDVGDDFPGMQVQRRQDRQGSVADILVIAADAGVLVRHWRQVWRRRAQRLHARLLVDADGVHRQWSRIVHCLGPVEVDVAVDHKHFGHLALELLVALFEVVAHAVGLEFVRVKDAPDGGLACPGQPGEPHRRRVRSHMLGQCRQRPQFGGHAQRVRFAARQVDHPGLGFVADLRGMRPVKAITQAGVHARSQRLVDALVDRRARHAEQALYLRGGLTLCIRQQHLRALDLAQGSRSRTGQFLQHRALFDGHRQRCASRLSSHASLHMEMLDEHDRRRMQLSKAFNGTKY
uniref:Uncharacterized protein n=1 Tax=mine drainage metagenome TaxID=410659 RepID=E6PJU9_9ZZZZ